MAVKVCKALSAAISLCAAESPGRVRAGVRD